MNTLYDFLIQLFYQLANAFFFPVAFALLGLFAFSLIDLGVLLYAAWRRRGERSEIDLSALASRLGSRLADGGDTSAPAGLNRSLTRFWQRVELNLVGRDVVNDVDIWLDEAIRHEENISRTRLDRSLALVRIGPMLGLAGTIIPLGPALKSLLGGNMAGMVDHLVVGFGAVVCGLVLSGVAYYVTLVRERWARNDLKQMEDFGELVIRFVERTVNAPRANLHSIKEEKLHVVTG